MSIQPPPKIPSSGDQALEALESPLTESDRPSSSMEIDPKKLITAWESMVAVQRELIAVVQRNEEDNELTRKDNVKTRLIVILVLLVVGALLIVQTTVLVRTDARDAERAANVEQRDDRIEELLHKLNGDVGATLAAMRAVTMAMGATVEAQATEDPTAIQNAAEASVEAQKKSLQAEARVAPDPTAIRHELETVERKAAALKIDPEVVLPSE